MNIIIDDDFENLKPQLKSVLDAGVPGMDFVVLDIDDTVLHSGRDVIPRDDGMWVLQNSNFNNLDVYYVTARPDTPANREYTLEDLASVGITSPRELIMRPTHITDWLGISEFKTGARRDLELRTGGTCLMTVGDQWTDLMTITPLERGVISAALGNRYIMFKMLDKTWGVKLTE